MNFNELKQELKNKGMMQIEDQTMWNGLVYWYETWERLSKLKYDITLPEGRATMLGIKTSWQAFSDCAKYFGISPGARSKIKLNESNIDASALMGEE